MNSLFASLISLFVVEPLQADLNETLRAAQAPQAIVQQVETCARDAVPSLATRAANDWWWGFATVVRVSLGSERPEAVVASAAPSCGPAISAVRPFLAQTGG